MRVFFVTDRRDAHAERFSEGFRGAFGDRFTRVDVSIAAGVPEFDVEGSTRAGWDTLSELLETDATVVVSGPLDTVSSHLVGGSYRHVGISWATDVMVDAASSAEALEALTATVTGLALIVTDNYATENAMVSLGVSPDRICRIPWGPQPTHTPEPSRANFGIPDGVPVILYPRSIEAHYQPEVFLEALERVLSSYPSVLAVVVETGSQVPQFQVSAAQKGLTDNIHWQPVRPPEEFAGLIACADVVVVTTVTDGTSVTVMDAMAQGIPVVASLTNGSAEWMMDGVTGWTFPVGDSSGLARALGRVLAASPSQRGIITANARRLVAARAGWARSEAALIAEIQKLLIS
jgi:glycosyltransferase involved in cell wall biosynthesis